MRKWGVAKKRMKEGGRVKGRSEGGRENMKEKNKYEQIETLFEIYPVT